MTLNAAENIKYDVAVIGGGPAGSSVSMLLSRAGLSVCLIEKKEFPREVLCGEFLSLEVIEFLVTNKLFDKFLSLNPNYLNTFKLHNGNSCFISPLGFSGYALRRSLFDQLLLNESSASGTMIFQPAEVTDIVKDNNSFDIKINSDKGSFLIKSKIVVVCYGKQNILDKKLGREFHNFRSGLNGVKFHIPSDQLSDFSGDSINIYTGEGIYCGVNMVDNNLATVCYLEKRSGTATKDKLKKLHDANSYFNKLLPDPVSFLSDLKIYGTGNIYFGKRNLTQNGIFMCGDAAGVIPPLAGDGIGMAIESAQILCSVLRKHLKENLPLTNAEQLYEQKWRKAFSKRLKTAAYIQKVLLNSFFQNTSSLALKLFPQLLPFFIKNTRNL